MLKPNRTPLPESNVKAVCAVIISAAFFSNIGGSFHQTVLDVLGGMGWAFIAFNYWAEA